LDDLEDIMPCVEPDPLCVIARQEVRTLLDSLRLPLDERGRRRAAARAEWFASRDNPLETHDILDT
jgi:chromosome partitioning protein